MDASPSRYAPHLSEFYSLFNNHGEQERQQAAPQGDQEQSGDAKMKDRSSFSILASKRSISLSEATERYSQFHRPSSIRSTTTSITDLQTLVTKKDMLQTHELMNKLVDEIGAYASSLAQNAKQASNVAFALENLAHLKGCNDDSANKFLNVSGVFHLLANHDRIIANLVTETLGPSLRERISAFSSSYKDNELSFKKKFKEETHKLKLQENYNIKLAKRKNRNLFSYRENLLNMQQLLDSLETLKHGYYQESYHLVEASCQEVLKDMATLTRAQIEISENLARKGWSGGGLDDLIIDADDPFSKDKTDDDCDEEEEAYPVPHGEVEEVLNNSSIAEDGDKCARTASDASAGTFNAEFKLHGDTIIQPIDTELYDQTSEHQPSSLHSAGNVTILQPGAKNKHNGIESVVVSTPTNSALADYSFSLPLAGSKGHTQDDRNGKKVDAEGSDHQPDSDVNTSPDESNDISSALNNLTVDDTNSSTH